MNINKVSVHKFGGSSLIQAESFKQITDLLTGNNEVIVISAIKTVTTSLLTALNTAVNGMDFSQQLADIQSMHINIIQKLFSAAESETLENDIKNDFLLLNDLLTTAAVLKDSSQVLRDTVMGFGEIWSGKILTALLAQKHQTYFINAKNVLYTYQHENTLYVDWPRTQTALSKFLEKIPFTQLVITGFIASDANGKMTTLGRNGSDFSAAIFAKLFTAEKLVIWKDVDGIFSADPSRVRSAFPIDSMSYHSALELAYFGAAVIHPKTITPVLEANIPIYIKNLHNPQAPGTLITQKDHQGQRVVEGITSIDDVALITIEGTGLIGVSGTAMRVFQVMEKENISVILISQASSEHSICFAIKLEFADKAVQALNQRFEFEIQQGFIESIKADKECAILAVVGDGMVGKIGVSQQLTRNLARADINIKAIAQGSSERNISIVLDKNHINKALKAVHAGFYLSDKSISIGIIGPGLVGQTLITQIQNELQRLQERYHVRLMIRGICNSRKMILSHQPIDLEQWQSLLEDSAMKTDLNEFSQHIVADDIPNAVIIDCTANQVVADHYLRFIELGSHIITPNKRANSADFDQYQRLRETVKQHNKHLLYETTVCAGLPVITTLHDIIKTGDEIIKIEGIVSGTLSYVFNRLADGLPFSEVIKEAKAKGFTEPDPRDDLAGMDVARKIVILARELGFSTSLEDLPVLNLVPEALRDCDVNQFMEDLPNYDEEIAGMLSEKTSPQQKPVYLGSIHQDGTVRVDVKSFPEQHPFSRLKGTDNMLIFYTKRYCEQPLIIQGPGAGAEVTAAGIFADLLRLVSYISI